MPKTYSEKLRDPRWQKKRLQVLERDKWVCRRCFDGKETLQVHHIRYHKGDPWDTPDDDLISFCETCHDLVEDLKIRINRIVCDDRGFDVLQYAAVLAEDPETLMDAMFVFSFLSNKGPFWRAVCDLTIVMRKSFQQGLESRKP